MIYNRKLFTTGIISIVLFFIVLIIFFSPVFKGQNGLEYLDNSISKGSAYYIPKVKSETEKLKDKNITMALNMGNSQTAEQTLGLFEKSGAKVTRTGSALNVTGDLG